MWEHLFPNPVKTSRNPAQDCHCSGGGHDSWTVLLWVLGGRGCFFLKHDHDIKVCRAFPWISEHLASFPGSSLSLQLAPSFRYCTSYQPSAEVSPLWHGVLHICLKQKAPTPNRSTTGVETGPVRRSISSVLSKPFRAGKGCSKCENQQHRTPFESSFIKS